MLDCGLEERISKHLSWLMEGNVIGGSAYAEADSHGRSPNEVSSACVTSVCKLLQDSEDFFQCGVISS